MLHNRLFSNASKVMKEWKALAGWMEMISTFHVKRVIRMSMKKSV
jgi:hypothetical protein